MFDRCSTAAARPAGRIFLSLLLVVVLWPSPDGGRLVGSCGSGGAECVAQTHETELVASPAEPGRTLEKKLKFRVAVTAPSPPAVRGRADTVSGAVPVPLNAFPRQSHSRSGFLPRPPPSLPAGTALA